MLNQALTPLMQALVDALEYLGGEAREVHLHEEAARRGESGRYGPDAHFAKGTRALVGRGILRREVHGAETRYYFTDAAWADLDYDGPAPRSRQIGLL